MNLTKYFHWAKGLCSFLLPSVMCIYCQSTAPHLNPLLAESRTPRYRVVWMHGGNSEEGGGMVAGFDSRDSASHLIFADLGSHGFNWPLLYKGGTQVILTDARDRSRYTVWTISWNGHGLRYICDGACSDVWKDPSTGKEWAIVRTGGEGTSGEIWRIMIEDTSQKKLLWNRTPVGSKHSGIWYQVSADGNRAAGCFPWGKSTYVVKGGGNQTNGEIFDIPDGGCWYSMAPDNSYHWFFMYWNAEINGHAGIRLYRDTQLHRVIDLRSRGRNEEHFHTRFASNSGKVIVTTVGYPGNASCGSDSSEIMMGHFTKVFDSVVNWVRITHNNSPDYSPDAWVGVDDSEPVFRSQIPEIRGSTLVDDEKRILIVTPYVRQVFGYNDTVLITAEPVNGFSPVGWLIDASVDSGLNWNNLNDGSSADPAAKSIPIPTAKIRQRTGRQSGNFMLRLSDYSKDASEIVEVIINPE